MVLKFPYETKLIDNIRDLAKLSQGLWKFDTTNKLWRIALTESNVVAAHGFAKNNNFEIDPGFDFYLDKVLECEADPYEIKLVETDTGLTIQNASHSLTEAINNYCGFDYSNLDILVDNSAIYGYAVDENIVQAIVNKYSPRICNLMTALESKFTPDSDETVYRDLIKYAEVTGRYPIYVYEPDLSGRLYKNFVERYFEPEEVHRATHLKPEPVTVHKKLSTFISTQPPGINP